MSRELRIGIIAIITLAVMIWGYQFLKGKNLFKKGYNFEVVFKNVEGLDVASPVEINGLVVGAVSSIDVNPEDVRTMIVKFDIEGEFQLPDDTRALYAAPSGIIGNRKIIIEFDELCDGTNCLKGGERLQGGSRGVLASVIKGDEVDEVIREMRTNLGPMMDTVISRLTNTENNNTIGTSLESLDKTMKNLASLTGNLDNLVKSSNENLNSSLENLAVVMESFANTNKDLENMITNLSTISSQIVEADLGGTLDKTNETIDNSNQLLTDLRSTVDKLNLSFDDLNTLLTKVETGEGTIGKLINDPEIYYNLEETSKHLALLLQDLRLNPKRYVRLSVFGRKGNPYTPPEDDPAYQDERDKSTNNE